ncbi:MAG: cupredoxin domain-containing protein [Patescibacteria group bacterium]
MNKGVLIIITIALVAVVGIIFWGGNTKSPGDEKEIRAGENVEIKDDVQYITVSARGGYSPKVSYAKAGIPTKLVVKTYGTFDCSSSLVIHELNYRKILDQNSEEVIDLGTPEIGTKIQGVCSMGMYSFVINFS